MSGTWKGGTVEDVKDLFSRHLCDELESLSNKSSREGDTRSFVGGAVFQRNKITAFPSFRVCMCVWVCVGVIGYS